jgi:hypothetical protein
MVRGIFYLFLALCVAATLRFVLAIRARIRRRQQSRRMEEGIAKYLSQTAAKKISRLAPPPITKHEIY